MTTPNTAPGHAVQMIAALAPAPHTELGTPSPEQWRSQLQMIADRVWAEAFYAGAAWNSSITTPKFMVVTEAERDRLEATLPSTVVTDCGAGPG